jgi:DNA repair protein RecO
MFAEKHGRIAAFCRRGRAFKRESNAPQAPALARVGLIHGEHKLARLVSCELDPDAIMPLTPKLFGLRAYIAEVIEKMLPEEDVATEIFALVRETYAALRDQASSARVLRAFELKLLDHCGYLPEMPTEDDAKDVVAFDAKTSCFVYEANESSFDFSHAAIELAKAMLIAKIGSINYGEDGELLMIGRIFQARLKVMGLFPLKSVAFLKQLSGR